MKSAYTGVSWYCSVKSCTLCNIPFQIPFIFYYKYCKFINAVSSGLANYLGTPELCLRVFIFVI